MCGIRDNPAVPCDTSEVPCPHMRVPSKSQYISRSRAKETCKSRSRRNARRPNHNKCPVPAQTRSRTKADKNQPPTLTQRLHLLHLRTATAPHQNPQRTTLGHVSYEVCEDVGCATQKSKRARISRGTVINVKPRARTKRVTHTCSSSRSRATEKCNPVPAQTRPAVATSHYE